MVIQGKKFSCEFASMTWSVAPILVKNS